MISGKRLAPRRLGAYFVQLPTTQIGIGSYEAVGEAAETSNEPVPFLPKVVTGPEGAGPTEVAAQREGAKSALLMLAVFGLFSASGYAGYQVARKLGVRA